jgi:acyl-CoA synthetase (AMP-forming)/AMP-acid ligase II
VTANPLFPLEKFGSQIALIDGDSGRSISYQELARIQKDFNESLLDQKTLIFLFSQNSLEDLFAYVSAMNQGHVVCLLDFHLDPKIKLELIQLYHPGYVMENSEEAWSGYHRIESPVSPFNIWKIDNLDLVPKLDSQLSLLLSTSGTTGSPKMIRLSRQNIISNADAIIDYLKIGPAEKAIASLPIHYSYGLSVIHTHLMAGATLVLTQKSVLQAEFWEVMKKYGCTSFAGVPYTYRMLDRIGFESLDLPSLKTMTQAGGHLEKKLVEKFHSQISAKKGKFFVMYGQTEATARIAYLPPEMLPAKSNAIGKAIPKGMLKLYQGIEEIQTPGRSGELVYFGANVMMGYAEKPEDLVQGDLLKGILHTGDLAYFDAEGIFYITGRLKRISKVYGLRLNLDEIEEMVSPFGHAVAVSDDNKIYLYFEEGSKKLFEKCVQFLADALKLHYTTFECRLIKRFPLTASGKIDYKQLL